MEEKTTAEGSAAERREGPVWHLLQASDVLDLEFATALSELVPVIVWEPQRSFLPWFQKVSRIEKPDYSALRVVRFPLLHGYARFPMSLAARTGASIHAMLLEQTPESEESPLICTVPFFAPVAERWKGPVVYWLTDLIAAYSSAARINVPQLDRRMCQAATLVCPNSERLATYLIERAGCDPAKIHIVPNATRAANLLPAVPTHAVELPDSLRGVARPVAGVIGNLAGNMDWLLLERMVEDVENVSWIFVGPATMAMRDPVQGRARAALMRHKRAHFIGRKPYGELAAYARSFDVAVLPYLRCEPTFSGSSTRFYEHLAACRPMIATLGLDELSRKVPLLRLCANSEEAVQELRDLELLGFEDGFAAARWLASREATWQVRARSVQAALRTRLRNAHASHESALSSR